MAPKGTSSAVKPQAPPSQLPTTKRRKDLKAKAGRPARSVHNKEDHVLEGADYVTLMLGGRRKAKAEASKLQADVDESEATMIASLASSVI